MTPIVLHPLPGAGLLERIKVMVLGLLSRRLLLRLTGARYVVILGQPYTLKPRPLGVARDLVPAIIRASERLLNGHVDDEFYGDLVLAMSLGLGVPQSRIESWSISLWDCARVLDAIARVNGLQAGEGGQNDLGKLLAVWNGMNSTPASSAPPAGHGITSIRM